MTPTPTADLDLDRLESAARAATYGPWVLCHHLQSAENDASCPCGYRGGIWGGDQEHVVCEMGSTAVSGEEGLCLPRYPRDVELANAAFIAAFNPATALALISALRALEAEVEKLRNEAVSRSDKDRLDGEEAAFPVISRLVVRATTAEALVDRLRQEAEIHAGEARAHKSSLHEAYQAVSGAKGEPGNWNGAEPIRAYVAKAEALAKQLGEVLEGIAKRDMGPSSRIAAAALSRTRPSGGDADGEQSQ